MPPALDRRGHSILPLKRRAIRSHASGAGLLAEAQRFHGGASLLAVVGGNAGETPAVLVHGMGVSQYTVANAGTYYLLFGVTNWDDELYDSGLAIANVTIAGEPVGGGGEPPPPAVPEPASLLLVGTGIAGIAARLRRG